MTEKDRNYYKPTIYLKDKNLLTKGYVYNTKRFNEDYVLRNFTIPKSMEYRPDLISLNLYGTIDYDWLLIYVNNAVNAPKEFESGASIYYVPKEYL